MKQIGEVKLPLWSSGSERTHAENELIDFMFHHGQERKTEGCFEIIRDAPNTKLYI